jgi:hypothetical protein
MLLRDLEKNSGNIVDVPTTNFCIKFLTYNFYLQTNSGYPVYIFQTPILWEEAVFIRNPVFSREQQIIFRPVLCFDVTCCGVLCFNFDNKFCEQHLI